MGAPRRRDSPEALRNELARHPGRLALVCGSGAEQTAEVLAVALGGLPMHVGQELTRGEPPEDPKRVEAGLASSMVYLDCEILFDPELRIDPLQLFRALARRAPRFAVWPGRIEGRRAIYSEPGRRDHYDGHLTDALVLRPRVTVFPDEVPYTIERIP